MTADTSDAALIAWCEKKIDALDAAACDDPAAADTPSTAHDEEMFRALAARLRDGWRTMDDAPRDGTPVDLFIPGRGRFCDVEWGEDSEGIECWVVEDDNVPTNIETWGVPSAWMLPPAPPEAGS